MLSLIVSTLGRSTEIEVFLKSLVHQTLKDFEVILVDQNDDDRLVPVIDAGRWPYTIRRIHTPAMRGISRGRNIGAEQSAGDILLFPDDDCWYPPWFLAKGKDLLDRYRCAAVSGRAANETGRSINGRFEKSPAWVNRKNVWTTQIEWTVFFRKNAFRAVKGYDESIGVGSDTPWQANEGQDITLRLMQAGYKSYYDPTLHAGHAELNITKPDEAMIRKGRGYARGLGHVLKKHGYGSVVLSYWLFRPAMRCVIATLKGNGAQGRYYRNVVLGRLEGWRGRTFQAAGRNV